MKRQLTFLLVLTGTLLPLVAQLGPGTITGSLQTRASFYQRDSLIGAADIPQYDRQLFGAETWLALQYSNLGFDIGLRFDLFNNSQLLNPSGSYNAQGIGRWYVKKSIGKLDIAGGYLYDQIGSGIIFRAWESRPLLIDNALYGARLTYHLDDNWFVRGFTGRQKQQFDAYESVLRGANVEGFVVPDSTGNVTLAPGFGAVARTLDDASMNSLVATLNTYLAEDAFVPNYNAYAFTLYNTLTAGNFIWYVEGAYKTEDTMNDPFGVRTTVSGDVVTGNKFFESDGSVLYSSLSYARRGFGAVLEAKRTENFGWRTRPQEQLNRGLISFIPPMGRVNTYRLTARYNAVTQDLGELAYQADISYAPSRKLNFNFFFTDVTDLDQTRLYREFQLRGQYKFKRTWQLIAGLQRQEYNQEVFEFKPGVPIVKTWVPFFDFLYKLDRRKALRFEFQYMNVGEGADRITGKTDLHDYGNWLFGQIELTLAPHWTFTASDMYNSSPGKNSPEDVGGEKISIHYPRFDVFYTNKSNRFSLSYIKQVEGIVCTGGVCRLEPAFSGLQMAVSSTF